MSGSNSKVTAYVLVEVPAKRSGGVVEILRTKHADYVKEAYAIFGDYDVVAKVEVDSVDELQRVVFDIIQNLPQVKVTRTYIVASRI